MSVTDMASALAELEVLLERIASIVDTDFEEHKLDVVALRRSISIKHSEIFALAESTFVDAATIREFRSECYHMRAATARHQAEWPVVMISLKSAAYLSSLGPMREANRRFIAWTKRALADCQRRHAAG